MGKAFSGRRPEDKPMYIKPNQLDYEKRALLVTSVSTTFKNVIHTIIDNKASDDGEILDGGDSLCSIIDTSAMILDLGDST